jgi:RNA polymerase sigma-70 factor (ECF subfamily)
MDGLADDGALASYPYLHAGRADLLRRLGRRTEAAAAYRYALTLTANRAERSFLERRLREVEVHGDLGPGPAPGAEPTAQPRKREAPRPS